MGAVEFMNTGTGATPGEAFDAVVQQANYDEGHSGYTGTIAEKTSFKMIDLPDGKDPREHADELIIDDDPRISDKWGPAGCIALPDNHYLFFGLASS